MQRMVAASRQAVERARRQAEAEAPLDNALRARLAALPNNGCVPGGGRVVRAIWWGPALWGSQSTAA